VLVVTVLLEHLAAVAAWGAAFQREAPELLVKEIMAAAAAGLRAGMVVEEVLAQLAGVEREAPAATVALAFNLLLQELRYIMLVAAVGRVLMAIMHKALAAMAAEAEAGIAVAPELLEQQIQAAVAVGGQIQMGQVIIMAEAAVLVLLFCLFPRQIIPA
jgi:hypothetical protein